MTFKVLGPKLHPISNSVNIIMSPLTFRMPLNPVAIDSLNNLLRCYFFSGVSEVQSLLNPVAIDSLNNSLRCYFFFQEFTIILSGIAAKIQN